MVKRADKPGPVTVPIRADIVCRGGDNKKCTTFRKKREARNCAEYQDVRIAAALEELVPV